MCETKGAIIANSPQMEFNRRAKRLIDWPGEKETNARIIQYFPAFFKQFFAIYV